MRLPKPASKSKVVRQAVLLSAGLGTRLKPLTDRLPKVMVPIAGTPLLEHHVRRLAAARVEEVFINLFHKKEVITDHFGDGSRFGVSIRYAEMDQLYDPPVMLSKYLRQHLTDRFLVVYGDVFSLLDYRRFTAFHVKNGAVASLVVHESSHPEDSDLIEVTSRGRVRKFWMKPHATTPPTRLSSTGCHLFEPEIFDYLPETEAIVDRNFRDVFLRLHEQGLALAAYETDDYMKDIGTLERLKEVEALYPSLVAQKA